MYECMCMFLEGVGFVPVYRVKLECFCLSTNVNLFFIFLRNEKYKFLCYANSKRCRKTKYKKKIDKSLLMHINIMFFKYVYI